MSELILNKKDTLVSHYFLTNREYISGKAVYTKRIHFESGKSLLKKFSFFTYLSVNNHRVMRVFKSTLAICLLVFGFNLTAQEIFYLKAPVTCGDEGDQIAIAITGQTEAPTASVEFSLDYDPAVLKFDSFSLGDQLLGLPNASHPVDGMVNFSWLPPDSGQSLLLKEDLLVVYFSVQSGVGSGVFSSLEFYDVEITKYIGAYPFPIPMAISNGAVFADCLDFMPPSGQPGIVANADELQCVDSTLSVDIQPFQFENVNSLSFTLEWDPLKLSLDSIGNLSGILDLDASNFSIIPGSGKMTFEWAGSEQTLLNDDILFTLNFHSSAQAGEFLKLDFSRDPMPIAAEVDFLPVPLTTISEVVQVLDESPPVVSCPDDVFQSNSMLLPGVSVLGISPVSVTDNCGPVTVSYSLSGATIGGGTADASGEVFQKGVTVVEYTATDAVGNAGACSFEVTVADTFRVAAASADVQCQSIHVVDFPVDQFIGLRGLQFSIAWDPSVLSFDSVAYQNLPSLAGFGEISEDTLTFVWFDFDDSGETYPDGSSIFGLQFDVIGDPGDSSFVEIIGVPTKIEASVSEMNLPVGIPAIASSGLVRVIDTVIAMPPVAPADTIVACFADVPLATSLSASFQCLGSETVDPQENIIQGSCPNQAQIIRTWTFSSTGGSPLVIEQIITVDDQTAPEFLVQMPGDTVLSCESYDPNSFVLNLSDVSDNCSLSPEIVLSAESSVEVGSCPNERVVTNVWTVIDECGNSNSHTQVVTVIDQTPPVFLVQMPNDTILSCEDYDPNSFILSTSQVSDNCSSSSDISISKVSDLVVGSCANERTVTNLWTIEDECGNTATHTQVIIIVDTTAPVIQLNAPSNITVECGFSLDPVSIGQATATDNCSSTGNIQLTFSDEITPGCGSSGTINRVWLAVDECGNSSTREQTIVSEDNTPPLLSIPLDVTLECSESTDPAMTGSGTAIDVCGDVTVTYTDVFTENCGNAGLLSRTWTAEDACGNSVSATQNILIQDTQQPTIDVAIPQFLTAECDEIPGAFVLTSSDVSDECSDSGDLDIEFTESIIPGGCLNEFVIERIWIVTDQCGNSTSSTQEIMVSDGTPPAASCQDVTVDLNEDGIALVNPSGADGGSTDNCGGPLNFSVSKTEFNCDDLGENPVTLFVSDDCGNESSCNLVVTVEDNIPPELVCPDNIYVNLSPGECEAAVNWTIEVSDNCQLVGTGQIIGFLDEYDPLNWTISADGDGVVNSGNAPTSVTLVGANDGTFGAETNICITIPADGQVSFDWSYSSANSSAFWDPFGYILNGSFVQLTTTAGGLNQSGSLALAVLAGDVLCFSQQSVDGSFGAGTTVVSNLVGPAEFAIEPIQTSGPLNGTYFPIGVNLVGYEISDIAGNISTCEFEVTVEEFPNPITSLACNDLVNISLDAVDCIEEVTADLILEGGPYGCYDDYLVSLFDENGISIGSQLSSDQIGQTVTVIVTDPETGNSCEGLIYVEDKSPPELNCSDLTVNCDDSVIPQLLVGTTRTNSFTFSNGPLVLYDGCDDGILEVPIPVQMDGVVTDVDVAIQIQHSWVGDLSAALRSPDGTIVKLFERPGTDDEQCFDSFSQNGNSGNLGCSADGIDAIFDGKSDNSAQDFEELCVSGMNGTFKPLQSMTAFFGKPADGEWTLLIYDGVNSGVQTGQLLGASLVVTSGELGEPMAFDACGDVELAYSDVLAKGQCSDPYLELITRTWVATDNSGNSTSCTQIITVERNSLFDVILPEDRNGVDAPYVSCSNPCTDPTYVAGDPCYIPGAQYGGGTGEPSNLSCGNLGAFYEDIISGEICSGGYTIIRHWIISDWCTGQTLEHDQIIQVNDLVEPELNCPSEIIRIGADGDCSGNWFINGITATDDCSSLISISIEDSEGSTYNQGQIVSGLSLGNHLFTVEAEDDCGNVSSCTVTVRVEDLTPPVAICDEFTTIGLGNLVYDVDSFIDGLDANAELCYTTVNDGSYDNCNIEAIKLRRMDGQLGSQQMFKDCIYFSCDDIGNSVTVEMRVYDKIGTFGINDPLGRYNSCMVEVEVFDAINPVISCPASKTVECWEYDWQDIDGIIPAPINLLPVGVPPAYLTVRQIDVLTGQIKSQDYIGYIGGYPGATDNCAVDSVRIIVNESIDNCGEGTVTRFYSAYEPIDPGKSTPDFTQCVQVLTISHSTPFDICDTQPWNTPVLGCSFGHSTEDGVEWPGDIQLGGCGLGLEPNDLEQRPDVNPFDVRPRIFDDYCDLIGVNYSDTYLTVFGQGGPSGCVKVIRKWIVVDWCQEDPSAELGYATWTYNQEIDVLESEPPQFTPESCQDVTFCLTDDECQFRVLGPGSNGPFPFANATDDCTETNDLNVTYKLDVFNDGIGAFGGFDFTSDFTYRDGDNRNFPSPPNIIDTLNHDDNPSTEKIVEGKFPVGVHKLFWKVEDGCGNVSTCAHTFEIKDCIEPTPVCYNSIVTVALAGSGEVDLLARTFDAGSYDNCTPDSELIIAFSDQVTFDPVTGEPIYDTVRTFTCDDLGTKEIEIWVKDAPVGYDDGDVLDDNWDFCVTLVEIQDPNGVCPSTNTAVISGLIQTALDEPVEQVHVDLNNSVFGNGMQYSITGDDGLFSFQAPVGQNYAVNPSKNINYLNGVSTFDLVLITQHILGPYNFDSPYQYIAADANNDGKVTTFDVLELRRLILQVSTELPNNQSWRFIDADWVFPNPKNPFTPPFPEVIDINALSVDELGSDFIGVKIGDVDLSATPNQFAQSKTMPRSQSDLEMVVQDREVKAGEIVEVGIESKNFAEVSGYQYTVAFDLDRAEFLDVIPGALPGLNESHFGLSTLERGLLATSWNGEGVELADGVTLYTLKLKVLKDSRLSDLFRMTSELLQSEAYSEGYTKMDVKFRFEFESDESVAAPFELYQNQPNPFRSETVIGFNLPNASKATLTIHDVSGKVVKVLQGTYNKGYHALTIDRSDLGASGILYYTLETDSYTATKKMVLID
ncbi:MAG: HYR domain-containing protein [Saprospiraceae bacterium]